MLGGRLPEHGNENLIKKGISIFYHYFFRCCFALLGGHSTKGGSAQKFLVEPFIQFIPRVTLHFALLLRPQVFEDG